MKCCLFFYFVERKREKCKIIQVVWAMLDRYGQELTSTENQREERKRRGEKHVGCFVRTEEGKGMSRSLVFLYSRVEGTRVRGIGVFFWVAFA